MNSPNSHNISHMPRNWALFTYYRPLVQKITNVFRNTHAHIAFHSTKSIYDILKLETNNTADVYTQTSTYTSDFSVSSCSYVGQTSHNLNQRHKEHITYIRNSDPKSMYAARILNNVHEYGNSNGNMSLLKRVHNVPSTNYYEQLYIHLYYYKNKLIPAQSTAEHNPLYQLIHNFQRCHSYT
jgi:hypothetical protein